MNSAFEEKYKYYQNIFENALKTYTDKMTCAPIILADSMKYSLLLGGKRLRPVLLLATYEMLGGNIEEVLPFSIAIEMIHTYSLIHDDLPAMDNDDFRRGKPSNHKQFGEANAILAGDGLLNTAYSVCFFECLKGNNYITASQYLCYSAGINGMISGQSADILFSKNKKATKLELNFLQERKTAKLITAPLAMASVLKNKKYFSNFERFGENLGLLFQITDDLLDETGDFKILGKTIGKDKKEGKLTYNSMYGVKRATEEAEKCKNACLTELDEIKADTSFFKDLVENITTRKK